MFYFHSHYAAVILCQILLSCVCVCVLAPFDKCHDAGISSCCLKLINRDATIHLPNISNDILLLDWQQGVGELDRIC